MKEAKGEEAMTETKQAIKECIQCGGQFKEKQISIHFECEHCIGKHEE